MGNNAIIIIQDCGLSIMIFERMNFMKKLFLIATILFSMSFSNITTFAQDTVNIKFGGSDIQFSDAQPFVDANGNLMVPINSLTEILNLKTSWNQDAQTAYIIDFVSDPAYPDELVTIGITVGEEWVDFIYTSGGLGSRPLSCPAIIKENRVFVPLESARYVLGLDVAWDKNTNNANIYNLQEIKTKNNKFEFKLIEKMPKDKNYVISPVSLKMSLAMAANGADGKTKDEMLKALAITDLDKYNEESQKTIEISKITNKVDFSILNSIWINEDYLKDVNIDFSDSFKETVSKIYGGKAEVVNNENGREKINKWIEDSTNGEIKDSLSQEAFSDNLSFLVNTVYMNADWQDPFDELDYEWEYFTDRNGKQEDVKYMLDTGHYMYNDNADFEVLAKPYVDNSLKMYIVLPKKGGTLTEQNFNASIQNMVERSVNLALPHIETKSKHENIVDILKDMGVQSAFNLDEADFLNQYTQGISENPFISDVIQNASINVNEQGTVASAGTIVIEATRSGYNDIVDFTCDRPFYYFIRNDQTGDILFMGEYAFAEQVD